MAASIAIPLYTSFGFFEGYQSQTKDNEEVALWI